MMMKCPSCDNGKIHHERDDYSWDCDYCHGTGEVDKRTELLAQEIVELIVNTRRSDPKILAARIKSLL